jgi:hypothetical protein
MQTQRKPKRYLVSDHKLGLHFPNGKLYVWVGPGHIQE